MSDYKVKYDAIVDFLFWMALLLFSGHDTLVRLFPMIPWGSMEIITFFTFILLTFISKRRNLRIIPFLLIVYIIVFLCAMSNNEMQVTFIKDNFLTFSSFMRLWIYFIIFSQMDYRKINKGIVYIAYINMILLLITTVKGLYSSFGRDTNYLGIGMTGAVWLPIIIQAYFTNKGWKKFLHLFFSVTSSIFILIYGNRGSILAIFLFIIFCVIHYTTLNKKIWIILITTMIFSILIYNNELFLKIVIEIVEYVGISSRNLGLFLKNQITYSTHRVDLIWINVLQGIKENWVIGRGLCYDRVINGSADIYAHNLILEVWMSFGLIIGSIMLLIYAIKGIKICFDKKNVELSYLVAPFFISTTSVLMFNNSFCQFGFFWVFFGILLSLKKSKVNGGEDA